MANPPRKTAGAPAGAKGKTVKKKEEPKSRRAVWIAAVVLVAIAVSAFFYLREGGVPKGVVALRSPRPEATLTTSTFVWRPSPGVSTFEIEIVTEGGDRVYATTVADTTADVPAGTFEPGKKYLWLVRGIVNGEAAAVSHIDRFTYQP
ncbi:MAG TPA: hypothetical protein VJ867_00735 [Gemmatimonadaceae bacterium]|nr:hypothetical protein [Gemmatimonadaceae bacterium]